MFRRFLRRAAAPLVLAAVAGLLAGGILSWPAAADAPGDAQAKITALIRATWDTPHSQVDVAPVAVSGHYAVAGWVQGEHGGRALLKEDNGAWSVVLCGGDPLKEVDNLVAAGVPASDAANLARDLAAAEALLPPGRRAAFSRFQGTVEINAPRHAP